MAKKQVKGVKMTIKAGFKPKNSKGGKKTVKNVKIGKIKVKKSKKGGKNC